MSGNEGQGKQRELDWQRGDQLRILRDCELPKDARGSDGKKVSAIVLKGVLIAIDHFARGKDRGCTASLDRLAASAGISRRQCARALAILSELGVVAAEDSSRRVGLQVSPMVRRTIVWSELALRCRDGLAAAPPPRKHNALAGDHSAPGADHSAPGADHSAPGADHSAPRGTLNDKKRLLNEQEAPSDVLGVGVVEVGAMHASEEEEAVAASEHEGRWFFDDELAAIRDLANTLNGAVQARTLDDRELVLKTATLLFDGKLTRDMWEQTLESFARKREQGDPVRNGPAWLWDVMRNQCGKHQLRFDELLACTDFPRELLVPPGQREAAARRTQLVDGCLIYTAAPKREASP